MNELINESHAIHSLLGSKSDFFSLSYCYIIRKTFALFYYPSLSLPSLLSRELELLLVYSQMVYVTLSSLLSI